MSSLVLIFPIHKKISQIFFVHLLSWLTFVLSHDINFTKYINDVERYVVAMSFGEKICKSNICILTFSLANYLTGWDRQSLEFQRFVWEKKKHVELHVRQNFTNGQHLRHFRIESIYRRQGSSNVEIWLGQKLKKTIVGEEHNAYSSIFSFSHNAFNRLLSSRSFKLGIVWYKVKKISKQAL